MQKVENKWLDLAIAGVTATAILAPLFMHDANARAVLLSIKNHAVYHARQIQRNMRRMTDPAWRRELADDPDDSLFALFATPEPRWYAETVDAVE